MNEAKSFNMYEFAMKSGHPLDDTFLECRWQVRNGIVFKPNSTLDIVTINRDRVYRFYPLAGPVSNSQYNYKNKFVCI